MSGRRPRRRRFRFWAATRQAYTPRIWIPLVISTPTTWLLLNVVMPNNWAGFLVGIGTALVITIGSVQYQWWLWRRQHPELPDWFEREARRTAPWN